MYVLLPKRHARLNDLGTNDSLVTKADAMQSVHLQLRASHLFTLISQPGTEVPILAPQSLCFFAGLRELEQRFVAFSLQPIDCRLRRLDSRCMMCKHCFCGTCTNLRDK